jgi:transcriptional regulator with XRE-family HTH domain
VPVAPEIAIPLLIRWARSDAALTQAALAARMGVPQSRIAELELPGANPSIRRLHRVATALNLRLELALLPR